jgi:hypothetical protein
MPDALREHQQDRIKRTQELVDSLLAQRDSIYDLLDQERNRDGG